MDTRSLGRSPLQPARAHFVYTDRKGRKISYANNTAAETYKPIGDSKSPGYSSSVKIELYGWKKKCLYALLISLLFVMFVNLVLILWMLKVLDFNMEGMGQLRVLPGGVQLLGQALMMGSLFASTIKSRRGRPIVLESSINFSVQTRDSSGFVESRLFIGNDVVECQSSSFVLKDPRGSLIMSATSEEFILVAEMLRLTGVGGAVFDAAVQVPVVRAPASQQLLLESPTRTLELFAAQTVSLESRAGDIIASCLSGFRLQSVSGSIRLDAPSIYMPRLKSALPLPTNTSHSRDPHHHDIYQLCVCGSGKLFLAPPNSICAARNDSLVCR